MKRFRSSSRSRKKVQTKRCVQINEINNKKPNNPQHKMEKKKKGKTKFNKRKEDFSDTGKSIELSSIASFPVSRIF